MDSFWSENGSCFLFVFALRLNSTIKFLHAKLIISRPETLNGGQVLPVHTYIVYVSVENALRTTIFVWTLF